MEELDVLLLAKSDHSNVGHLYAKALRSVGVRAEAWAVKPSPRPYAQHANLFKSMVDDVLPRARKAKAIQFMHSRLFAAVDIRDKFVTVFHGGSRYRHASVRMNELFNPIVNKSIIQTGDLLDKGAKNQVWLLPPIDSEQIQPIYDTGRPHLIVAHYPHKAQVKGSELVVSAVNEVKAKSWPISWKFIYEDRKISHKENLERIGECDVYIEAVQPKIRDNKYGEWGMTALEAASLGKIVITHFLSYKKYYQEYGPCPLLVANNATQLKKRLEKVLLMSKEERKHLQYETRKWAETSHSFEAVGARMVDKVYGEIL